MIDNELNYSSLAKKIKYSDVAVSNIIKGKTKPKFEFLSALVQNFPNYNPAWILTGKGNEKGAKLIKEDGTIQETSFIASEPHIEYTKESENSIPYFNIDITENLSGVLENRKPNGWINIPDFPKSDMVINARSKDLINNKSKIAIRKIKDKEVFNFGDRYLVVTDDYSLIKTINKSENIDCVFLVSDNKENASFDLPKSKIQSLYLVTTIF